MTLLEISISLVLFALIAGQMLWLFQWGHRSIKLSQERGVAYALAMRKLETGGSWTLSRASNNTADVLYNYNVEVNVSKPLWDRKHGGVAGEPNGFINFPPLAPDNEYDDPGYSNATNSVFLTSKVYWTDYLGTSQQISIGAVQAKGYGQTVLLLHCNGANGSTTFTDSSPFPHTVTANGNAQISTAQSKFSYASAYFDGSGDYLSITDSTDWAFGTGDFTIDFWIDNPNGMGGGAKSVFNANYEAGNWMVYFYAGALFYIQVNSGNTYTAFSLTSATSGWNHIAIVRKSGTIAMYLNGTSQSLSYGTGRFDGVNVASGAVTIGKYSSSYLNGYIDELRVSKGIARWTANFTPPTGEY